jgi:hypothetical protein
MASSSSSNCASKYSPGDVGAKAAGTVRRRLESSVTIMVWLSHFADMASIGLRGAPRNSGHGNRHYRLAARGTLQITRQLLTKDTPKSRLERFAFRLDVLSESRID